MNPKNSSHPFCIRAILPVAIFLSFLFLYSCQSVITPPASSGANAFRVALILPRSRDADSWTRAGYAGLLLIQKELGAEIAFSENVPEADFEKVFREYADSGYDFIIGHGNQFIPAAEKVAAEYPRIDFAIDGKYGGNNANLGGLSLREGEMAYLFGAIAAIKTKTGHIGYIGGENNAPQQEITNLYQRGALSMKPDIKITIDFVGNFTDAPEAERLAQNQIDSGVDVIFVLAGAAGMGIHARAEQAGIFTLAWIEDLHSLAPRAVLTSNVQDVPQMMLRGATLAKQGRWEGKQYKFGMSDGVEYLAPFYGLLTPDEEFQVNTIKNDLLTGKIDTTP